MSLGDCCQRYPEIGRELTELLKLTESLAKTSNIKPSNAFKIRARVDLMNYIHFGKSETSSKYGKTLGVGWFSGWARLVVTGLAIIFILSGVGTGTAYASQSSLPGDSLYSVKLGTEQLRRVFTFDEAGKISLELKFAETRLDELAAIMNTPQDPAVSKISLILSAGNGYEYSISQAISRAVTAAEKEEILEQVALAASNHIARMDEIESPQAGVYQEAMAGIKEKVFNAYMLVCQDLAAGNPFRAAEINLQLIQNRLERAATEAAGGDSLGVKYALQEYEKLRRFGEEISNSARIQGYDTTSIDELNARATSGHMEMLGRIYGGVPEETQEFVEAALVVAIEEHGHAVQGLQEQGAQGDIPTEPSMPAEIPEDIQQKIQGSVSEGPNGSGEPETPGPGDEQGQQNLAPTQQGQDEGNPTQPQPSQGPTESPKTTENPGAGGSGNGQG
jgi:hypothetical protein